MQQQKKQLIVLAVLVTILLACLAFNLWPRGSANSGVSPSEDPGSKYYRPNEEAR